MFYNGINHFGSSIALKILPQHILKEKKHTTQNDYIWLLLSNMHWLKFSPREHTFETRFMRCVLFVVSLLYSYHNAILLLLILLFEHIMLVFNASNG